MAHPSGYATRAEYRRVTRARGERRSPAKKGRRSRHGIGFADHTATPEAQVAMEKVRRDLTIRARIVEGLSTPIVGVVPCPSCGIPLLENFAGHRCSNG